MDKFQKTSILSPKKRTIFMKIRPTSEGNWADLYNDQFSKKDSMSFSLSHLIEYVLFVLSVVKFKPEGYKNPNLLIPVVGLNS